MAVNVNVQTFERSSLKVKFSRRLLKRINGRFIIFLFYWNRQNLIQRALQVRGGNCPASTEEYGARLCDFFAYFLVRHFFVFVLF